MNDISPPSTTLQIRPNATPDSNAFRLLDDYWGNVSTAEMDDLTRELASLENLLLDRRANNNDTTQLGGRGPQRTHVCGFFWDTVVVA